MNAQTQHLSGFRRAVLSCGVLVLCLSGIQGATQDASSASTPQTPSLAYTFTPIRLPERLPPNARDILYRSASLNDRGEVAFAVSWIIPADPNPHWAIYTQNRKVVDNTQPIDGKTLSSISSVWINNRGHVMYNAAFTLAAKPGEEKKVRYGAMNFGYFLENHFVWEGESINTTLKLLGDDDLVYGFKPSRPVPPAKYTAFVTFTNDGINIAQKELPEDIKKKLRKYVSDPTDGVQRSVGFDGTVLSVLKNPSSLPALPWNDAHEIAGPISNSIVGDIDWKEMPHFSTTSMGVGMARKVFFNSSGAPILMCAGLGGGGANPPEILSPLGLVTYLRVDREGYYYETGGYRMMLAGSPLINASGQILFRSEGLVSDGQVFVFLLASPR